MTNHPLPTPPPRVAYRYRWNFLVLAMTFAVCLTASCAACEYKPAPPPSSISDAAPIDASPDACAAACANLAVLKCKEGIEPNCAATCRHAQSAMLVDLAPACVAQAPTVADVRACAPAWRKGCPGHQ